jgi:hypothetical protein
MTHLPVPTPPASAAPSFGLIIIGDEILSGKREDKHLPKVIELLKARGLQLDYADYVGDSPERITATLKRAFASGDVVFSCGGIGATPDDHTRQCAARALGVDLALHPQADALIRERMQDLAKEQGTVYEADRPDNIHRLNMGVFPKGARLIPNPMDAVIAQNQEIREEAERQAERIDQIAKDLEGKGASADDPRTQLAEELRELAERLRDNPGDLDKNLAQLGSVEDDVRAQLDPSN